MFDYIIVGAGSAGCVMANRLSEDPSKRVCLVEAGPPDKNPLIHIPLGLALLARTRGINWGYETAPEPQLNGRRLYWPRGKTLGGSSSVNAMIYMRGHPADYEGWAKAAGPAWGWDRARELFLAMEGNTAIDDAHHGTKGPLSVTNLVHPNPLSRAFVQAGVECQLPENADFNGERQEGAGLYQVTQKEGRRFSAARAFLDPVRERKNLTIETGALVERVLFEGRRAKGLRLRGRDVLLRPGGEVIVCGGAVNSPQLLMLSGVGPGGELSRHGIEVVHDAREAGANLTDHLDITVLAAARGSDAIGVAPGLLPRLIRSGWAYAKHRQGELTSNVAEAGGFAKSDPSRERPNLQFHFIPALMRDHGRKTTFGYGVTLHVCDLLPKSRGRISLADNDPLDAAADRGELSEPPGRHRRLARRPEARAAHFRCACDEEAHQGRTLAGAGGADGRGPGRGHPRPRRDDLSPGRNLPDGQGRSFSRRSRGASARCRRASRGGCLDHALDHRGQHQRAGHDDGGERLADDAGAVRRVIKNRATRVVA